MNATTIRNDDARASRRERICVVCSERIPPAGAVYHAHLGVRTHAGACSDAVSALERTYDRSKRGRWRPVAEILQILRERRAQSSGDRP
jgi:hypothetical protein